MLIEPGEGRKWCEIERGLGCRFARQSWIGQRGSARRRKKTQAEIGLGGASCGFGRADNEMRR